MKKILTSILALFATLNAQASLQRDKPRVQNVLKKIVFQTIYTDLQRHEQMSLQEIQQDLLERIRQTEHHLSAVGRLDLESQILFREASLTLVAIPSKAEFLEIEKNLLQTMVSLSPKYLYSMTGYLNSSEPGRHELKPFAILMTCLVETAILPVELAAETGHKIKERLNHTLTGQTLRRFFSN